MDRNARTPAPLAGTERTTLPTRVSLTKAYVHSTIKPELSTLAARSVPVLAHLATLANASFGYCNACGEFHAANVCSG